MVGIIITILLAGAVATILAIGASATSEEEMERWKQEDEE